MKISIIITLIGYFISISNNSFSQTDSLQCNIKVTIDSYSGKKSIISDFMDFQGGTCSLSKVKGIIGLFLSLETNSVLTLKKGEIIYIKFSDNSVIKFINPDTQISDYSNGVFTNSFYFPLIGNNLLQLKSKKIVGIKCYITEYKFEDETPLIDNAPNTFLNNINCIAKTK